MQFPQMIPFHASRTIVAYVFAWILVGNIHLGVGTPVLATISLLVSGERGIYECGIHLCS